jgi:acyl transferase domain-containing protein/NADPH:quinone reductase-like Zn-dependent oxidoreductase
MKYAIIGISLKFPECDTKKEFWDILINNKTIIKKHPENRFNYKSYVNKENKPGKMNCDKAGYLENINSFDNNYFNLSDKETKNMDPQQKIMLELAEKCFIDSKINFKDIVNSKTGVIIGGGWPLHYQNILSDKYDCNEYTCTGSISCIISNRISYYYNLQGPSFTIDTACSSSGYALHQAINGMNNNDMDMCLVGGVNIIIPEISVGFSKAKMLSPDSKIKHLDDNANGYVRSEGASFILIKPLDKAIEDKNFIYSVIESTSINQDGKTQSLTMPSKDQQKNNISNISNNIDINKIIYYECHGTGTSIGDKVESEAIGESIAMKKNSKLLLGSVKTNFGHMESNSLMTSIIKVCLIMKNKQLVSNINFNKYNTKIDFDRLNIDVIKENKLITEDDYYIGINNYGFGGSNFCCLLTNYKENNNHIDKSNLNKLSLIKYSYNNNESLELNLSNIYDYEEDKFNESLYNFNKLSDKIYTRFYICESQNKLEEIVAFNEINSLHIIDGKQEILNTNSKICYIFTGQGSQYSEMGYSNYKNFYVFKNIIDKIDLIWIEKTGESFINKTNFFIKPRCKDNIILDEPIYGQTVMFFYQIAMIETLKYFGVESDINLGHSAGELASLYASNLINLDEAVEICYIRGILQQKTINSGRMLLVNLSETDLKNRLNEFNIDLEIGVENSENSCVLSGNSELIKDFSDKLKNSDSNIFQKLIPGSCSFHSKHQDILKTKLYEKLLKFKNKISYNKLISSSDIDNEIDNISDYLWNNIRNKVEFKKSLEQLKTLNPSCIIEIGPHPTLKYHINNEIENSASYYYVGKRNEDESTVFLNTLAQLYLKGVKVKIENFGIKNNIYNFDYTFNKKELVLENKFLTNKLGGIDTNSLIININKYPYFKDHNINNKIIIPTVGYINLLCDYYNINYINFKKIELINMYELDKVKYININVEKKDNIYILKDDNNILVKLNNNDNINKIILDNCLLKELNNDTLISNNDYYSILKSSKVNFQKELNNVNNFTVSINKNIIVSYNNHIHNHYKILDIGLTNGFIFLGYTNNCFVPNNIESIYLDRKEQVTKIISELIEKDKNKTIFNSYFINKENKVVGYMKKITCININYVPTKIYSLTNKNILEDNFKLDNRVNDLIDNKNLICKNNYIKSLINEGICTKKDLILDQKLEEIVIKPNSCNNYCYNYLNNKCSFYAKPKLGLQKDEILIKNKFTAVNFKDIMVKIGKVKAQSIGMEFSGIVEESKSKNFKKGDLVFGWSEYCFSNYVICHQDYLFKIPNNKELSFCSVFPIVYGTAYVALIEKANIKDNDSILIHSATSSFGLACIEICKLFNVNIYATCGTEEKKEYLKKIGINNVANSRDETSWDNEFDNIKFDVIINCLSGDKLLKNFNFINENGIIIDVSKRDSIENNNINLAPFLKSISYISLHFDYLLDSNNSYIRKCVNNVIELLENNKIGNIPYKKFMIKDIDSALNYVSKGNHVGKVIIEIDDFIPDNINYDSFIFDPNKFYLITGGNSDFSLKLVEWMISKGGAKFILLSRSSVIKNSELYNKLIKQSEIINLKCDITDMEKLESIINSYDIDGYFHTANVYNDKLNSNYTKEEIINIWNPKAVGIKNLDIITRKKDNYSYFLAFTSISGYLGNPGQSIYAAANGYVEDIILKRYQDNIPGIAVALGPVLDTGILNTNYNLRKKLYLKCFDFIWFEDLINVLPNILNQEKPLLLLSNQKWDKINMNTNFIFENLIIKKEIQLKETVDNKLINYIKLITEIKDLDLKVSLISLGIDSLTSMSISNFCKNEFNLNLKQSDILNGISIEDIIKKIENNVDGQIIEEKNDNLTEEKNDNLTEEISNNLTEEISNNIYQLNENNISELLENVEQEKENDYTLYFLILGILLYMITFFI